jgi:hypothetical protein
VPTELVPVRVRSALRETVGGWGLYTVRDIQNLFADEGFQPASDNADYGGERRTMCERCQMGIDFTSPAGSQRYLHVVDRVIRDHEIASRKNDGQVAEDLEHRLDRVRAALARSGISHGSNGTLEVPTPSLTAGMRLVDVQAESDIRLHVERVARSRTGRNDRCREGSGGSDR